MISRSVKQLLSVSLAGLALVAASIASGQTTVNSIQTLDRVDVYNKTKVLEMEFDDPGRTFDFTALDVTPASTAGFSACQVTATQALYCVDGKEVVYWPKPAEVAPPNSTNGQPLFSCSDTVLGLDPIASRPCTAMTVDLSGAIWIAGKLPASSSHRLFKLVAKQGTSCPLSWSPLTAPSQYCARLYATYPRPIAEISAVDGDVGALFRAGPAPGVPGPGVLALATDPPDPSGIAYRRTVVFFRDDATALTVTPVVIASGSASWGSTQLQSVTLLQRTDGTGTKNFILATSTQGKVLAVDAVGGSPAFEVFDIVSERANSPSFPQSQCNTSAQQYGLRASSKSGRVYLTDRNYCQAVALETAPSTVAPFKLQNVQEEPSVDLTFSTTAAYPPDAATIAPGTVVNLYTCDPDCVLLSAADGTPAARLFGVKLYGSKSGMTLFQVKGIPDCRWNPDRCVGLSDVVIDAAGNSVTPTPQSANALFLNVTPLLPLEIRNQFDASGVPPKGLPRLLISPQYRGQEQTGFLFEALFGITEDGVVFLGTFSGEFDVGKLAGRKLGCGYDYAESLKPNRAWDVVTTVSERVVTAGGPGAVTDSNSVNKNLHVDTLTNVGCYNPTQISGGRWSMYAYNLEIAPNTDAVFAKLLVSLYNDLYETNARLACRTPAVDTGGSQQLSRTVCANLDKLWKDGKTKLDKCYAASTQPKSSAGAENCQAFITQVKQYETALNAATTSPTLDPANRLGELKQRVYVINHVYYDRFLPSIPVNGFTNR
jgi:hypothetical protein